MLNRRLTTEERQKVSSMIAELQSRNIMIPNELKLDKSVTWPKDSDGYFVKIDGKFLIFNCFDYLFFKEKVNIFFL